VLCSDGLQFAVLINIRLRYNALFVLSSGWSSVRTAVRQGAAAAGGDASGLGASYLAHYC
jgi:hypothetical protein